MDEFSLTAMGILGNTVLKIVCFILGFLTIKLGYNLIREGVKGEFNFTADYKGLKGGLVSSSPGLLFLLLGTVLIGYAMGVQKTITLNSESGTKIENKLPSEKKYSDPVQDSI